ncbi:hypothetical protein QD172_02460 [Cobetia sp. 10Alg 146]|uniref:hypothetical protein n=1 Tax=Cobetia sp. 10Alg 146 TaxID=3040019 RepID=UPI00244787FD|nr:hypothetical protein [Cobetia sp. 10Alg 146]MDH2290112.1 hypothetical protein [Cobetia sp. 10Alg 146]
MDDNVLRKIIDGNRQLANFWNSANGWAPEGAAEFLSKSRLDWQVELSETLYMWDFQDAKKGQLILAWANLGALVEGTLKLFFGVYYNDYINDDDLYRYGAKGKVIEPDILGLEKLKVFLVKKEILSDEWRDFVSLVQSRRNAIHAFKDRDIGDEDEFNTNVSRYLDFMRMINGFFHYPEEYYSGPTF